MLRNARISQTHLIISNIKTIVLTVPGVPGTSGKASTKTVVLVTEILCVSSPFLLRHLAERCGCVNYTVSRRQRRQCFMHRSMHVPTMW